MIREIKCGMLATNEFEREKTKTKTKTDYKHLLKEKKEETLKHNSRIYNIVNKVEVLENINEN